MGGALRRRRAGSALGHRLARTARAKAAAHPAPPGHGHGSRSIHAGACAGVGRHRRARGVGDAGAAGRRIGERRKRFAGRGRSRRGVDRLNHRNRIPRSFPARRDTQFQPGCSRLGSDRYGLGRRFRRWIVGWCHWIGQDRGLSGSRRRRPRERTGRPGSGLAAGNRPHPSGDRSVRPTLRGRARRMALGRRPAAASSRLGTGGDRSRAYRGRRSFSTLSPLQVAEADHRR